MANKTIIIHVTSFMLCSLAFYFITFTLSTLNIIMRHPSFTTTTHSIQTLIVLNTSKPE